MAFTISLDKEVVNMRTYANRSRYSLLLFLNMPTSAAGSPDDYWNLVGLRVPQINP